MPFIKGNSLWKLRNNNEEYRNTLTKAQKNYRLNGKKQGKFCVDCNKKLNGWVSRCHPCVMKLVVSNNRGRKASIDTRIRLRESHIGQVAWNKGTGKGRQYYKYPSIFWNEVFRKKLKTRDSHTCRCIWLRTILTPH